MNRENLQRMADHIRTVPQEKFSMEIYREDNTPTTECNTVGCVIGHCIYLGIPVYHTDGDQDSGIDYLLWAWQFTGMSPYTDEFKWCFSMFWENIDNSPTGAALRIEWLLNHGLPDNWIRQYCGQAPLCYLPASN